MAQRAKSSHKYDTAHLAALYTKHFEQITNTYCFLFKFELLKLNQRIKKMLKNRTKSFPETLVQ